MMTARCVNKICIRISIAPSDEQNITGNLGCGLCELEYKSMQFCSSEQSLEQSWAVLLPCSSSDVLVFVLVNLSFRISSEVLAKLPSGNFTL